MYIEASLSLSFGSTRARLLSPVASAQRELISVSTRLLRLEHELHEISEILPVAPDQWAMEEDLVAQDVATWLRRTLGEVKGQLRSTTDRLREASQRSEEDQRNAFYERSSS